MKEGRKELRYIQEGMYTRRLALPDDSRHARKPRSLDLPLLDFSTADPRRRYFPKKSGVVQNGGVGAKDQSLLAIFKQNEKRRQLLLSFQSEENEEAPLSIKQLVEELVLKRI